MPRKVFTAGEVLAAADVNEFLQDQAIMTFAGTAARGSAIPTPVEGMVTYLEDSASFESRSPSAWVPLITPGAWSTYNPTLAGITLGNGTLSARYSRIGRTVHFWIRIIFGTTTAITSGVAFGLPIAKSPNMGTPQGEAFFQQVGVLNTAPGGTFSNPGSNNVTLYALNASGTYITTSALSATIPFTWANTHQIGLKGTYEAAP